MISAFNNFSKTKPAPFSFGSHFRILMISFTRSTERNMLDVRGYFWYSDCNSGFERYSP